MKVIIVDDEMLARVSLKSMIMEWQLPIEIVGEGASGEDLVNLVREYSPEVAFVDIKMPKMNGLEGIRVAKGLSPHTQWIILTGFSEFDYAREAINLGAASFLLKPVMPEELEEKLRLLIKQNNKNKGILNKEFESYMILLCNGIGPINKDENDKAYSEYNYTGAVFCMDSFLNERARAEKQLDLSCRIRSTIDETADYETRQAFFVLPSGNLAIVYSWRKTKHKGRNLEADIYLDRLKKLVSDVHSENYLITMLKIDECSSQEELHGQLMELDKAVVFRVIAGITGVLCKKDFDKYKGRPPIMAFSRLIAELSRTYNNKEYFAYIKLVKDLEGMLEEIHDCLDRCCWAAIEEFTSYSMDFRCNGYMDNKYWVSMLKEYGEELLCSSKQPKHDMISEVKSYIQQNYMYDMGISEIAEKMNVTPNYLSMLFHKKTGTTFIKYLTEIRMLKAKELLADQSIQVQKAAALVGYYSARHFTKLFKDYFGVYPSEYRKKLTGKA